MLIIRNHFPASFFISSRSFVSSNFLSDLISFGFSALNSSSFSTFIITSSTSFLISFFSGAFITSSIFFGSFITISFGIVFRFRFFNILNSKSKNELGTSLILEYISINKS